MSISTEGARVRDRSSGSGVGAVGRDLVCLSFPFIFDYSYGGCLSTDSGHRTCSVPGSRFPPEFQCHGRALWQETP